MTLSALAPWFWVALALALVAATAVWLVTRASRVSNAVPGRETERESPEGEFAEFLEGEPERRAKAS
jgi:hypothetical protein